MFQAHPALAVVRTAFVVVAVVGGGRGGRPRWALAAAPARGVPTRGGAAFSGFARGGCPGLTLHRRGSSSGGPMCRSRPPPVSFARPTVASNGKNRRFPRLALWGGTQHPDPAPPRGGVSDSDEWIRWSSDSLERATGVSLWDRVLDSAIASPAGFGRRDMAAQVHGHGRYAVLSHGTEDDPLYCYFNRAALEAFGYSDSDGTSSFSPLGTPSSHSAPDGPERSVRRDTDVRRALEGGVACIAHAVRQTRDGSLVLIPEILLWNVYDDGGVRVGQTALFDALRVQPWGGGNDKETEDEKDGKNDANVEAA